MEPQFAELAVQLPRVGLAQQKSFVSQEVDVERRPCELISRQLLKPVPYFRFQLNRTPSHSVDAISRGSRQPAGTSGEPWNQRLADRLSALHCRGARYFGSPWPLDLGVRKRATCQHFHSLVRAGWRVNQIASSRFGTQHSQAIA